MIAAAANLLRNKFNMTFPRTASANHCDTNGILFGSESWRRDMTDPLHGISRTAFRVAFLLWRATRASGGD
jgi:hypothetical protein